MNSRELERLKKLAEYDEPTRYEPYIHQLLRFGNINDLVLEAQTNIKRL